MDKSSKNWRKHITHDVVVVSIYNQHADQQFQNGSPLTWGDEHIISEERDIHHPIANDV